MINIMEMNVTVLISDQSNLSLHFPYRTVIVELGMKVIVIFCINLTDLQ